LKITPVTSFLAIATLGISSAEQKTPQLRGATPKSTEQLHPNSQVDTSLRQLLLSNTNDTKTWGDIAASNVTNTDDKQEQRVDAPLVIMLALTAGGVAGTGYMLTHLTEEEEEEALPNNPPQVSISGVQAEIALTADAGEADPVIHQKQPINAETSADPT